MIGRLMGVLIGAGLVLLMSWALNHWRQPAPLAQSYHDYVEQR